MRNAKRLTYYKEGCTGSPVIYAPSERSSLGLLLQWYLMCSSLYYEQARLVVPDETFDMWCRILQENWDDFDHRHKYLVCENDLKSGTGYALKYPLIVQHAALGLTRLIVRLP